MEFVIIAVGRARRGPEAELFSHYQARLRSPCRLIEIEARSRDPRAAQREESSRALEKLPTEAAVVVLDSRGQELDSTGFAKQLASWRDGGRSRIAFLIGGADGWTDEVRRRADLMLAFGRLTWPHLLVRGMLAEQLYRAETILAGHPYHRD